MHSILVFACCALAFGCGAKFGVAQRSDTAHAAETSDTADTANTATADLIRVEERSERTEPSPAAQSNSNHRRALEERGRAFLAGNRRPVTFSPDAFDTWQRGIHDALAVFDVQCADQGLRRGVRERVRALFALSLTYEEVQSNLRELACGHDVPSSDLRRLRREAEEARERLSERFELELWGAQEAVYMWMSSCKEESQNDPAFSGVEALLEDLYDFHDRTPL
ncbi:MAG: hypothetical protein AAF411_24015 [Myxococcota bacterium]